MIGVTDGYIEKCVLYVISALGACLSCVDLVLFVRTNRRREVMFLPLSRFAMWISIMLSSKFACACCVFASRILCFWWIFRFLTDALHLNMIFTLQSLECVKEICLIMLDIAFAISINVLRIKQTPLKISSLEDPLIEEGDDQRRIEKTGSWWDLFTFGYIGSIMKHGSVKQLEFENLLPLPPDMDPFTCCENLLRCWQLQECNNYSTPSLIWSISGVYGWPYFRLGLLKVFNDCIGFAGPLFLNRLIKYLEKGSGSSVGYTLAISLGLISIFKSFLDTQYTFRLSKFKLKLRSSIMSVIYRKCLWVNTANRSGFSEGEIQTFMSVDADRIVNLCNSLHDMWSLPLQIGIALYLLYTQVKFAFLSGLAITILLIPVNKWISVLIASATEKMMKLKDERIRKTGELLTNIRTLKMYGWDNWFADWLKETRATEVTHLATRKYLDAWCVFFWATTPTLFSLCTFGLFALMGHQLDAATVFTCLALFNSLISPLNSFPWVINGLIDAFISTRRVSKFLCCLEHSRDFSIDSGLTSEDLAVFVEDASSTWSSNLEEDYNLTIKHVSLRVPKGSFVAVIGEVGSGKTSLLNSLLGEMRCVHGSILLNGSVAYVPQVPWILSGTIRENILFGKPFDSKSYFETLSACALDVDISLMAGGDMACIGDKGVNLSGGQRARLALARAVYHGSDMYLLDDVLSAVDSQVGCWILQRALLGPLLNKKTRVMCTHNIQAISCADMIVVMDKGKVKWSGTVTDMPKSISPTFSLSNDFDMPSPNHLTKRKEPLSIKKDDLDEISEAADIVKLEERKEGRVEVTVYRNYAAFSGWFIAIVILVSAVLMQASRNGNDLWLSYWVDKTGRGVSHYSTSFYLMVLCIFCIINSILTLVRAFSFAFGGLKAAVHVHSALISKLINAPTQFFDQTPSGRILNRFSSDLYTIDDSLPFILNILLANFVGLLGIIAVLSYVQVLFLLLLLPFWYIYSKLQFFYRSTSRELRRLDSVSRSPIYASFTETLDGSSTIRAFKSEEHFVARFIEHLTLYQRTSYSEIIASLWLSLRLQLLGAMIVLFVAVMAVLGSRGNFPISFGTPGLVGLALSYAAPLVSLLGSFLTSFTETEKEMVSIERVLQYMDVPQEEVSGRQSLSGKWPVQGLVEFHNVTMRYISTLPPALNHISFTIQGGMHVGVIGRTGAGKSSILNALFRLTPVCNGEILVDGININHLPIRKLRSHLAVVPQSPFLFQGSLRDNLDPLGLSEDWRIWEILEKCKVKAEVESAGGLDSNVKESGCSYSVGQRQLLCLARALLKSSKILCLDECTANIDVHTASLLHNTISTECKGVTVITIAHRISTVLDLDSILILDRGILVEQGKPQHLLQDDSSTFSSFVRASK
ncbi:ABC transporter C family member 13 isoform X3 [Arabidopsis lyrata subsp. lyrata]|uniref:ABC transporter C family member 13 isoform X3 n=1 Tax=Arabidopsis lyrata subsp. lyrata TaxID=81972 RepID=UPI000A29BBC6|nr:ABC transporter C family member 13 isoform X3 [Arabidopsis lyrata subsp. lyrata]XP_020887121.1 ABC transporter C family member 13 isoform X3 [Arabidopsis lyrata subsp. lyrata]|eukprot:XP_020887120.1 ABC transporter C family member 13 isoform X3 [Arabidopsis lyrata subsp. lyrata]